MNISDDISFEEWFEIFTQKVREGDYTGPIDKYTFEGEWEQGMTPEASAQSFLEEMFEGS